MAFELQHFLDGVFHIVQQQTFGQLQLQGARIGPGLGNGSNDLFDKIGLVKLPGADVDGDAQVRHVRVAGPSGQLGAGRLQHPLPQGQNLTTVFGQGNEQAGGDEPALGVAPANEGLATDDLVGMHLRLEEQLEMPLLQAGAHFGFHLHTLLNGHVHIRGVELQRIAASGFGLVHGQIGAFEQFVGRRLGSLEQGDAHAGGGVVRLAF